MNDKRPSLRYGRVVYAWIKDNRGFAKLRPALILTADDFIATDSPIVVAAITTTFPESPPRNHVLLPWDPRGRASTKLRQRSAAVLNWQAIVEPNDVIGFGGDVPARLMLEIERRLDEIT